MLSPFSPLENMADSPGAGFKCCSMCSRFCFETHGDFGSTEVQTLLSVPTFFSLIKRSHIEGSKFLRIPVLFYEDCKHNVGRALDLIGPWGFKCRVTAERHHQGYVLRTGFKPFLDHHMIDAGDSLVFYLIGESIFSIKVYDKFGSEKKDPSTKYTPRDAGEEEDPAEDSEGEGSGEMAVDRFLKSQQERLSKKKVKARSRKKAKDRLRSESFSQPPAGSAQQEIGVDVSPLSKNVDAVDMKQPVSLKKRSAQKRNFSAKPDTHRTEESENELEPSGSRCDEAKVRQVKDANDLIEKLSNASQLVVMAVSHLKRHRVYLQKLQSLLPEGESYLTVVDEHDEQYSVKWIRSENSRSRLSVGWNQFVADHKLLIGDVCVFEVENEYLIKVHIFPLAKYYNPTAEKLQQEQDHRDDLQPSAFEQSMSEEVDGLASQEGDTVFAGLRPTKQCSDKRQGPVSKLQDPTGDPARFLDL